MRDSKREGTTSHQSVPAILANWSAFIRKAEYLGAREYPLFTDATVTGQWVHNFGPYRLLNTGAFPTDGISARNAVVLRVDFHDDPNRLDDRSLDATDDSTYHGGELADEVAALVSLASGMRLKAGDVSRVIRRDDAPGHPVTQRRSPPTLLTDYDVRRGLSGSGPVLPNARGEHSLAVENLLTILPGLELHTTVALIRTARLYQDALWISESQPNLSWLFLVSAVETAANQWRQRDESVVDRLKASRRKLYDLLVAVGGVSHAMVVADEIAASLGVTKKFIDFVLSNLPDPPVARPPEPWQVKWSRSKLKHALSIIYRYRSRALHEGTPFPEPLCQPMWDQPSWAAPAELPIFSSISMKGGAWRVEDLPLSLNTFEHLARGAILKWWASLSA